MRRDDRAGPHEEVEHHRPKRVSRVADRQGDVSLAREREAIGLDLRCDNLLIEHAALLCFVWPTMLSQLPATGILILRRRLSAIPPLLARRIGAPLITRNLEIMEELPSNEKAARFRSLHDSPAAFVIPNPWDIGSARLLAGLGFHALATSSAASATAVGRRDGELTRDEALTQARLIVDATNLTVSADLESGFGWRITRHSSTTE